MKKQVRLEKPIRTAHLAVPHHRYTILKPHQGDYMPRLDQATRNGTPYYNIMDHRSDISKKWREVDDVLRFRGLLDPELKEEVRRAIAQQSGCRFCASLGEPKLRYDDPRVAVAVRFGAAVARDPKHIADADFDALREYFSAEEIVELSCWICFMYGAELFGAIMNLDPATDAQKTKYEAWLEHGKRQALKPVS